MKTEYEFPGGTVVRLNKRKWDVFAPDGRSVGRFPTLKLASQKAQHWDKWDAFDSLQDICFTMCPFVTALSLKMLYGIKGGKLTYEPTEEEMEKAVKLDALIAVLRELIKQGIIKDEKTLEQCLKTVFGEADDTNANSG